MKISPIGKQAVARKLWISMVGEAGVEPATSSV
jgi:hypothetical protein